MNNNGNNEEPEVIEIEGEAAESLIAAVKAWGKCEAQYICWDYGRKMRHILDASEEELKNWIEIERDLSTTNKAMGGSNQVWGEDSIKFLIKYTEEHGAHRKTQLLREGYESIRKDTERTSRVVPPGYYVLNSYRRESDAKRAASMQKDNGAQAKIVPFKGKYLVIVKW